ncbi:unnamed protein product [Blepharisma stoltei]|uniref:Uncharacterized protein n=1 Tax=Blepharisma stoltei TaxID=1481888 RepID=A0AAU9JH17_9CILI|nr:unnamed protein product [Blepharisma stoltei]
MTMVIKIKMLYRALQRCMSSSAKAPFEITDMAAFMFTLQKSNSGSLNQVLQSILDSKLNLTHIESRPASLIDADKGFTFIVDVETPTSSSLENVCQKIKKVCGDVTLLGSLEVPWFPRRFNDIDGMQQLVRPLHSDHPGVNDPVYWARRQELGNIIRSCTLSSKIPIIQYTNEESQTWQTIYHALSPLYKKIACEEFLLNFKEMENKGLITENEVPQIANVNKYLMGKTGFQLKPISGMEKDRDFLNCLAFRVFPTTIHMRHHSQPYFSIDPDVAHEVIGHAPILADPEFAEFVQEIGLASLGATEEDIEKLMNLYFYSIEIGLIMNPAGDRRVYGARILSSVDEIHHALSIHPELRHFDPFQACNVKYHRKDLQSMYWFCEDFREAKILMERYASTLQRPFNATYDRAQKSIKVSHKVKSW